MLNRLLNTWEADGTCLYVVRSLGGCAKLITSEAICEQIRTHAGRTGHKIHCRLGLDEGRGRNIDIKSETGLAGSQALRVAQPHLQQYGRGPSDACIMDTNQVVLLIKNLYAYTEVRSQCIKIV
jgi:hypothetical protein